MADLRPCVFDGRLLSHTDSNGNEVQYEYDALGRVALLEPPQGTNYRTEYAYNANGSLDTVSVYDSGTPADTTYTYDTTTGQLLQRDFPTVSTHWIRTAYSYDSAGRLEYETVTKENGGTTNLHKTQYAYSWPAAAYVRQVQPLAWPSVAVNRSQARRPAPRSGGWVKETISRQHSDKTRARWLAYPGKPKICGLWLGMQVEIACGPGMQQRLVSVRSLQFLHHSPPFTRPSLAPGDPQCQPSLSAQVK